MVSIRSSCHVADLLLFLPTDIGNSGNINYTERNVSPFHKYVNMKLNKPGTVVASPAGSAIGCSKGNPCDITWKVDVQNEECPCAFNISCCANRFTLSFWWSWDQLNVPVYRFFLDYGGIFVYYNPKNSYLEMSLRLYRYPNNQWLCNSNPVYGKWQHVIIMVQ